MFYFQINKIGANKKNKGVYNNNLIFFIYIINLLNKKEKKIYQEKVYYIKFFLLINK